PRLVAPQPERISGLEQSRVPERRQPALAALPADRCDLLVGVVEDRLQLPDGERALGGLSLGLLAVHRGVPLVADLDRARAEPGLAFPRPLVGRVDEVCTER